MKEANLIIQDPAGMHARPAGELVKIVKSYPDCQISLSSATRTVNASSMLSLLSLGLKQGAEVKISVSGAGENEALESIVNFISQMR